MNTTRAIIGLVILQGLSGCSNRDQKLKTSGDTHTPIPSCISSKVTSTSIRIQCTSVTAPISLDTPWGALTIGGSDNIVNLSESAPKSGSITFRGNRGETGTFSYNVSDASAPTVTCSGTATPSRPRVHETGPTGNGETSMIKFSAAGGIGPYNFSNLTLENGYIFISSQRLSDSEWNVGARFWTSGVKKVGIKVTDSKGVAGNCQLEVSVRNPSIRQSVVDKTSAHLDEPITLTVVQQDFLAPDSIQCSFTAAGLSITQSGTGGCIASIKSSVAASNVKVTAQATGSGGDRATEEFFLSWTVGPGQGPICTMAAASSATFVTSSSNYPRSYPFSFSATKNGQSVSIVVDSINAGSGGSFSGSPNSPSLSWSTAGTKAVSAVAYVAGTSSSQREYCNGTGTITPTNQVQVRDAVSCNLSISQTAGVSSGQTIKLTANAVNGIGPFKMVHEFGSAILSSPVGIRDQGVVSGDELSHNVSFDAGGSYQVTVTIEDSGDANRRQTCSNFVTVNQGAPGTPVCNISVYREGISASAVLARAHDPLTVCASCSNVTFNPGYGSPLNPSAQIAVIPLGGTVHPMAQPIFYNSSHEACVDNIVFTDAGDKQFQVTISNPPGSQNPNGGPSATFLANQNLQPAFSCAINGPTQATLIRQREFGSSSSGPSLFEASASLSLDVSRSVPPISHHWKIEDGSAELSETAWSASFPITVNYTSRHGNRTISDRAYDFHDDIDALGCRASRKISVRSQLEITASGSRYSHCAARLTNNTSYEQKVHFWSPGNSATSVGEKSVTVTLGAQAQNVLVKTPGCTSGSCEFAFPKTGFFSGSSASGTDLKCRIRATVVTSDYDANYTPKDGNISLWVRPHQSDHDSGGAGEWNIFP